MSDFLESYLSTLNSNGFKGGEGRFCYSKFLAFLKREINSTRHTILVDSEPIDPMLSTLTANTTVEIVGNDTKVSGGNIIDNRDSMMQSSVVIFLTNDNVQKYNYEQPYYKNIVFIGPVTTISHQWLCNAHYTMSIRFCLPNLTSIGMRMLNGCFINCMEITHLDFRDLPLLEGIGWEMFAKSRVGYNVCPVPKLKSIKFNYRENLTQKPMLDELGFTPVAFTGPAHLENINGEWWFTANGTRVQLDNLVFGRENWQEWKESQDRGHDLALEKAPIQMSRKDIVIDSISYTTDEGVVCDIEPSKSGRKIVLMGPIRYYEMETIKSYIFNGTLYEHSFDVRV
jgi:hypothetical protein